MPYFGTLKMPLRILESVLYLVPFPYTLWCSPCTCGKRLEFLPGTAITTAVRVVKDECGETELSKTRMFARKLALVVMEIIRSRASGREDLSEAPSYDPQEKLPSLPIPNLELLFLPFPVYITRLRFSTPRQVQ